MIGVPTYQMEACCTAAHSTRTAMLLNIVHRQQGIRVDISIAHRTQDCSNRDYKLL